MMEAAWVSPGRALRQVSMPDTHEGGRDNNPAADDDDDDDDDEGPGAGETLPWPWPWPPLRSFAVS